jgi:SAM-dependent methyltransferase
LPNRARAGYLESVAADQNREGNGGAAWDGDQYQARFDELAAEGKDVHGEASFVSELAPRSVLDAGCGTGRVAIELARRGLEVVGVDNDASMLATARERGPAVTWVESDLTALDLGRAFDVVVMAGNVPLFCAPGTEAELVAGCARHVVPGGALVCGFQLDGRYDLASYDEQCAAAGMDLAERWATWDWDPFPGDGSYAVSVHRKPAPAGRGSQVD